jgi:Ca-activated chloride channel family protein
VKLTRTLKFLLGLVLLVSMACSITGRSGVPGNALQIEVAANTSLSAWLTAAAENFNADRVKTSSGEPVYVIIDPLEAGQAVVDITGGKRDPALWIPDNTTWVDILADQGQPAYQSDCSSLAQSPLVIGMWRPVAETLGWPGRELGWLDIGSLAADPSSWAYYSGGQFGDKLRLGHTHPGLSASGASTLLAVVQAAQSKAQAVTLEDIQQPIVQASVSAFEGAVSWFSSDPDALASAMRARGVSYLGAGIMYESDVIHYSEGDPQIVPIYPFEGTFMATHPACINTALDAVQQEGAASFRSYLLGEEGQRLALENGLRPVNQQVPLGAPLDEAHGVDLSQPAVIFDQAGVNATYAVQDLWQSSRKAVNLVMLLDTSGSMSGDKLASVQDAAVQFINQMGDKDYLTLIEFSGSRPQTLIEHALIANDRDQAALTIRRLTATGKTPLYDALGYGAQVIERTNSAQTSNVMVVLSDGMDTSSQQYSFDDQLIQAVIANDTTIFTIAYGSDADQELLNDLATKANGNFYLGDEASIAEIYDAMSAAFGGSAGIGR